jgi:miniconductance mechanosensitive channel
MGLLFGQFIPENIAQLLSENIWLTVLFDVSVVFLISFISWFAARKFVNTFVKFAVERSKNSWDDVFYKNKVFIKLANIAPVIVIYLFSHHLTGEHILVKKLLISYVVIVLLAVFRSAGNAFLEIYETFEISKDRPLKGIVQILNIIAYVIGFIVVIAIMMDKSPAILLSGLGAMTAIFMLVFRDTILGFVAGIQIVSNNSIRKGDWIVMSKYEADGEVIDIALHSVKVQNWDRTIVSIPTHKFLEESFTNWRGMLESGGRRISRSIFIDMSSIHYLSEEEIKELEKVQLISEYLAKRTAEIKKWNEENHADTTIPVNGRRLTNIGTFREYAKQYLLNHTGLRNDMTLLVRQLAPGENGLPLQIYVFTKTTVWTEYESVQSDIFDHLFGAIEYFGLRVFQNPSGNDFRSLLNLKTDQETENGKS